MKNTLILLLITFLFSSCAKNYEALPTVEKVNIDRYLGTWYEIARLPHSFEKDCKNVSATYTLKENEKIEVINRCTKITTNKQSFAKGVAYSTDESNAKLKVSFFRPFYGDYWILNLGENYKYSVVGTPSREYFWILSRTKTLEKTIKVEIIIQANKLGFDTSKLIWTIQE